MKSFRVLAQPLSDAEEKREYFVDAEDEGEAKKLAFDVMFRREANEALIDNPAQMFTAEEITFKPRKISDLVDNIEYHIVWGTKYRRKILKPYVLLELKRSLFATLKKYPALWIENVNTDDDHVHIQIEIPPNIAVSDAVGVLKAESSKHLRRHFKFIHKIYLERDGIWSVGYFSSTVGLNEEKVKRYIEWQGRKDKPQKARLF